MSRRMHFPAPVSNSEEGPYGTWHQTAWNLEAVKAHKALGGWFAKGKHRFTDRAAAIEAGVSDE